MKKLIVLVALLCCMIPALAQNDAGPNDTRRTHDYSRHIGSSKDRKLSTGWTSGHGRRTKQVHDYYRHNRSGKTTHVHGHYRSHRSRRR